MLRKLRKVARKILFGKRKQYYHNRNSRNYVTWHAFIKLENKVNNLIKHLKLEELGNTGLIGEPKDAKKFNSQWNS